jgi:hypothetical protein
MAVATYTLTEDQGNAVGESLVSVVAASYSFLKEKYTVCSSNLNQRAFTDKT